MRLAYIAVAFLVAGCAGVPAYTPPADGGPTAYVTFEQDSDSPITSTALFNHIETPVSSCRDDATYSRIGTIDRGNPLLASTDVSDVPIRANEPFTFGAAVIPANAFGQTSCSQIVTFSPRNAGRYTATAVYDNNECSILIVETLEDGSAKSITPEQLIECP